MKRTEVRRMINIAKKCYRIWRERGAKKEVCEMTMYPGRPGECIYTWIHAGHESMTFNNDTEMPHSSIMAAEYRKTFVIILRGNAVIRYMTRFN